MGGAYWKSKIYSSHRCISFLTFIGLQSLGFLLSQNDQSVISDEHKSPGRSMSNPK